MHVRRRGLSTGQGLALDRGAGPTGQGLDPAVDRPQGRGFLAQRQQFTQGQVWDSDEIRAIGLPPRFGDKIVGSGTAHGLDKGQFSAGFCKGATETLCGPRSIWLFHHLVPEMVKLIPGQVPVAFWK